LADLHHGVNARENHDPGALTPKEHKERIASIFGEYGVDRKIAQEYFQALPLEKVSEFDEPHVRKLVEGLASDVQSAMSALGLTLGQRSVMLSTSPTGSVSAFCGATTWDKKYHHVFVDCNLLIFCHSISKIVTSCFMRALDSNERVDLKSDKIAESAKSPDLRFRAVDLYVSSVMLSAGESRMWLPEEDVAVCPSSEHLAQLAA
jgi:hypothetical protein